MYPKRMIRSHRDRLKPFSFDRLDLAQSAEHTTRIGMGPLSKLTRLIASDAVEIAIFC